MLVSYKWLKRYVDIDVTPEELADKLTMAGIEIDIIERPWADISGLVAGKINSLKHHPAAQKLQIAMLDVGREEELQLVTGAPNVKEGDTVPVVMIGGALPGGAIGKAEFKGVSSYGMLCSQFELGLDDSAEAKAGVWILPEDIAPGTDLVEYLMLDDAVLDLDLTPNRSDCLSIINVAREVASIMGREVCLPEISYAETAGDIKALADVTVENTDLCSRYIARMVEDVKIGPSPLWMQHFLRTAGVRPISNVVDISNFVMLEWGQPLHTFDYDTLAGGKIIVRRAKEGEHIVTLDEKDRELTPEVLLICDEKEPVCIAGVMGGAASGISDTTQRILVESAYFDPVNIRRTAKYAGLRSEASLRFEKGVDRSNCDVPSRRAIQLLCRYCGAKAISGVIDRTAGDDLANITVDFRPGRVNEVLGTDYSNAEIMSVMKRLFFAVQELDKDNWAVSVPSYRQDISGEIDLVEEVARLLGYNRIPTTLPLSSGKGGGLTPRQAWNDEVVGFVSALGFYQVINYGFISPREWDKLNLPVNHEWCNALQVKNPLNEDQSIMRTSLLPGILRTASHNSSHRQNDLLIFELGSTFKPAAAGEDLPPELPHLALFTMGKAPDFWQCKGREYDFYFLKGVWQAIGNKYGINYNLSPATEHAFLHPGRAANIMIGARKIGFMGELHPSVVDSYDLTGRPCVLHVDMTEVFNAASTLAKYANWSKFPASLRDMAIIAPQELPADEIAEAIRHLAGEHLQTLELFDIYEGVQVPAGMRSMAYNLTFQSADRTLTDEEVNAAFEAIVNGLWEKFAIRLR